MEDATSAVLIRMQYHNMFATRKKHHGPCYISGFLWYMIYVSKLRLKEVGKKTVS
jgi:hypothetical protein